MIYYWLKKYEIKIIDWLKSNPALILSTLALIISVIGPGTVYDFAKSGNIITSEPLGYATRIDHVGKDTIYYYIFPIEWINTYKSKRIIISNLTLKVNGKDSTYEFKLKGEYPLISNKSFSEDYIIRHSIILDPNSISEKNLVFRSSDPEARIFDSNNCSIIIGYNVAEGFNYYGKQIKNFRCYPLLELYDINLSSWPHLSHKELNDGEWYYRDLTLENFSA